VDIIIYSSILQPNLFDVKVSDVDLMIIISDEVLRAIGVGMPMN